MEKKLKPFIEKIKEEKELLDKLYYKSKNQHKSSLMLRKLNELRRYTSRILNSTNNIKYINSTIKKNINSTIKKCRECFITFSSNLELWHFPAISLVLVGASSSIHSNLKNILYAKNNSTDVIIENVSRTNKKRIKKT